MIFNTNDSKLLVIQSSIAPLEQPLEYEVLEWIIHYIHDLDAETVHTTSAVKSLPDLLHCRQVKPFISKIMLLKKNTEIECQW